MTTNKTPSMERNTNVSAVRDLLNQMRANWVTDFVKARSSAEMAYELASQDNDVCTMAEALDGLAVCYWYIGEYKLALEHNLDALRLLESAEKQFHPRFLISVLGNLGMSQYQLGDDERAIRSFLRSLQLALRDGSAKGIVILLNNLGGIFWRQQDNFVPLLMKAAEGVIKDPVEYGDFIDEEFRQILDKLLHIGPNDSITDIYIEAYTYFIEHDLVTVESKANLLQNIGLFYQHNGQLEKSLEEYRNALSFVRENNLRMMEPLLQYNIASALLYLDRPEEALAHTQTGLSLAVETNELQNELRLTRQLSEILAILGRPEEALTASNESYALYQKHLNEQKNRQIAQIELKYEAEKQRRESQIAQQKAEIYRLRNVELEERVRQRTQQVLQMEKLYEVGKFAASIVHNLNGPLTTLLGALEAIELQGSMLPDSTRLYLDMLKTSADNMKKMIQSITRNVRTNAVASDHALDINTVLQSALEFRRFGSSRLGHIDIRTHLAGDLPIVRGQEVHFLQIFDNLLANAFDAMENQPVKELIVSTSYCNGEVVVEVEDSGCGIEPEHLAHIFDIDFTTKDPGKGTGLGLSITRQMVEAYRGKIHVASTVNVGTHFKLHFPAEKQEEEKPADNN